jgi:hypothetical protein
MAKTVIAALVAVCVFVFALPAAAQAVVQDIPTAGGAERVLFVGPASPRAIVFMFAGGDGTVAFNSANQITHLNGNFLMRTQNLWLAQGFAFATLSSSSSLDGRRHTPAYADTIARAIDFVRTRANVPVWLVGTSMGSIAAANGAAHLPGRAAGVVLSSSVAAPNRAANESVFDSDLGAIAVPALIAVIPAPSPGRASRRKSSPRLHARPARTSSTSRATNRAPTRARRCRRTVISGSRAMSCSASPIGSKPPAAADAGI